MKNSASKELDCCHWALGNDLLKNYHDQEWGKPSFDDQHLFELLILEGAQAGLSWLTILKRREGYQKAFANFDAKKIARFSEDKIERLMDDAGIIRNRLKIKSVIGNAKAFLKIQSTYGSFSDYLWQFVAGQPIINQWQSPEQVPAKTELSDQISKELKKQGFNFVGSTICYAYMQAIGMVNDHLVTCSHY